MNRTLHTAFDPAANSIALLRFTLACAVLVTHAFVLGGFSTDDPLGFWTRGQTDLGGLAVDGFFVLSGYLVTRSFASSKSFLGYLWRRILRIFPGYWICLVFIAFVVAPAMFILEHGYAPTPGMVRGLESPLGFLRFNALLDIGSSDIWGVSMKVPYWGSLDNSLWTLRYEFECYLLVGVLGVIRCVHRHRFVIALSTLLLGVILALRSYAPTLQPDGILQMLFFADPQRARLWFMFALGAFLFLYAPAIPMRRSVTVAMLALLVLSVPFGQFAIIGRLAYAYLCIAAAVFLLVYRFDRFGDFSYGIYIYGFPVQQFLAVLRVYAWGFVPYLVLAFVGTLGLALLSWHFVEKPSLRCKSWRWLDGRLLPSRVRDLALTTRTLPAQQ